VSCQNPIDAARLADYWIFAANGPDEDAIEEHLFACDDCGRRLREVIALADAVRRVAREGSLRMIVGDAFLRRIAQDGLRVREYATAPGDSVQCTVEADDDFLVSRLAADLSGAARVDLSICDEHGVEQQRLEDIPVRAGAPDVALQESITRAKAMPSDTMIMRLVAFDAAGRERALGEYTFHHTRSPTLD
jgi:hypothetical protein